MSDDQNLEQTITEIIVSASSEGSSAHAAIAAVRAHDKARGMVLVPRDATIDMTVAGARQKKKHDVASWIYAAMIAAAPDGEGDGE